MNVLLLLAHSIEEYDQVRLLAGLGYDVFSIGAYSDPANGGDGKRPPLPDAPDHPELRAACHARRVEAIEQRWGGLMVDGEQRDPVDWAKAYLPDEVIDWADVIICHHLEHTWLVPQWGRIRDKRVIWRTVGQSVEGNERTMAPLRADGLQIVRYSPKERNIPGYAGEDALIRFYKDPAEWSGWTGEDPVVLNIAQHDATPHGRDEWINWRFWEQATDGLPAVFAGPHTELIGGLGALSLEDMKDRLRRSRVYLYTGTQPASYTLGLIEAMMTGIPVLSIGREYMRIFPYGPELFEAPDILGVAAGFEPERANRRLRQLLDLGEPGGLLSAEALGAFCRQRAIELFGMDTIGAQWRAFLG